MNPEEIRKQTILALFSDEFLFERLVLKGGNAIHLAHQLALRSSLDLDFSMAGDFEDIDEARRHLFSTLRNHFSASGFVVFDELLTSKPKIQGTDERPWWGGYEVRFKLISREKANRFRDRLDKMRIDALPIGPKQERSFSVDLSKHEYVDGKVNIDFGEYRIPVYSLEMIAAEKLRALCQQMPEYGIKGAETKRARDFYDIHLIVTARGIDLRSNDNRALIRNIFEAKRVPLTLLGRISAYRDFHRGDWPAVLDVVGGTAESYDFYVDFVLSLIEELKPLWVENAPL